MTTENIIKLQAKLMNLSSYLSLMSDNCAEWILHFLGKAERCKELDLSNKLLTFDKTKQHKNSLKDD